MALPNDGQMTNTTITVSEYRAFLDNTVSDIAKGNTEFVGARTYVNGAQVLASNGFKYISQRNGNQGNDPLIDDGSNWRINDPVLNVVASLYTGGDESKICRLVNGTSVNGFTYGIYSGFDGYSIWSIGSVTGTMTSDFNPVNGIATGLSSPLTKTNSIQDDITELSTANNARTKTALNATGSAPIYACRAWASIDMTGATSIRGSGNVIGVIDNSVGDITITYATAMPDSSYSVNCLAKSSTGSTTLTCAIARDFLPLAGSVRITTQENVSGTSTDADVLTISVFR